MRWGPRAEGRGTQIPQTLIISRVNQKKIKSSRKEYVMWTCFKFWPMKSILRKLKANKSLIMACLQLYQKLLSLVTFLRVHSNSKEVSYLPCQNTYPNLKTTCHIKLKFFLWTKLKENLLLAKYIISVTAPLIDFLSKYAFFFFNQSIQNIWKK